jgi:hypothetical protein
MSERAPYSRVYWSVMEDPKFDGIREDVRLFGSWSLLLIVADMAWPAPAYVPPTVPKAAVRRLTDCGLLDALSGGRFRVHGLDAERGRRRDAARGNPKRDPDGTQTGGERDPNGAQAEPSLAKPSNNEDETRTARDPADIYWQLTGKYPADKSLTWIDELTSQYGAETVIRHLVGSQMADRSVQTLLGRTQDRLRAEARKLDKAERADEEARLREKRAIPRKLEPWQEEFRKRIQAQYDDLDAA